MLVRSRKGESVKHQKGVGTLVVSVILLFLATVLSIAVSRTTVMEQRMSANEIRHKQAFEAAQAGLDQAMVVRMTLGVDPDDDGSADPAPVEPPLDNGAQFRFRFCEPDGVQPVCPDVVDEPQCTPLALVNFNTPRVVSCGWSDDLIARKMVRQDVSTVSALVAGPTNPLTARGAVLASGSANVVNYFNNLSIWAGGPLANIGNSGKTFIRNPNVSPPPAGTEPPGEPSSCSTSVDYVCVTDKNTTGPDVIDIDPTLSNLAPEDMFRNYFGQLSVQDYIEYVATTHLVSGENLGVLEGIRGESIVVDGPTVSLPNTGPNTPSPTTIGSRDRPVVLIIDGDLDLQGTPTVHGLVYVTGDVTGGGNLKVLGAMVVAGEVDTTGSVDIIFDPFTVGNAAGTGRPGWIPGSWRDW